MGTQYFTVTIITISHIKVCVHTVLHVSFLLGQVGKSDLSELFAHIILLLVLIRMKQTSTFIKCSMMLGLMPNYTRHL